MSKSITVAQSSANHPDRIVFVDSLPLDLDSMWSPTRGVLIVSKRTGERATT